MTTLLEKKKEEWFKLGYHDSKEWNAFDKVLVPKVQKIMERAIKEAYKDGYENGVMDKADNINKAREMGQEEERERVIEEIKVLSLPKDPTISNKEWEQFQHYEAGFERAKELIIYILKSKPNK